MSKYFYCPICGETVFQTITICPHCKNSITPYESLHESEYYKEKSMRLVGNYSYARQILFDEEIINNPLYGQNSDTHDSELEFEKIKNEIFSPKTEEHNIPKCPTCGSTNIKDISKIKRATHAYLFGLFSKTARSQFECQNCHYKW